MGNIFREQRRSSIVMAALTLLLGLLLVLAPNRSIRLLCTVLGAAMLVAGLIYLFTWLAKRREGFPAWFLIPGLILAALGLWLLTSPGSLIVLIQFSVAAVLALLLGLLLVLAPNRSIRLLCTVLGAALLVTGLIYLFTWLAKRRDGFPAWFLIPGLILAALGLWLLTSPGSVIVLIQFSVAAVLIFHGVIDLQGAVSLARLGIPNWWVDLVLAVLTVVLGGVVLLNPFGTMEAMTMLIGASLVYDGASDLYLIYRVSKAFRDGGDL